MLPLPELETKRQDSMGGAGGGSFRASLTPTAHLTLGFMRFSHDT